MAGALTAAVLEDVDDGGAARPVRLVDHRLHNPPPGVDEPGTPTLSFLLIPSLLSFVMDGCAMNSSLVELRRAQCDSGVRQGTSDTSIGGTPPGAVPSSDVGCRLSAGLRLRRALSLGVSAFWGCPP